MKSCLLKCFGLCAVLSLFVAAMAPRAAAQATSGQIVGQVTDSTGAVVPGAVVTATDEQKGVSFIGRSDAAGDYTILNVTPGHFTVVASHAGFADARIQNVTVEIDQRQLLNFKLTVGSVTTTVQVTGRPPVLQTQTAEVGTVISGSTIQDLPLLSRNFYDLTTLVPGVSVAGGSINSFALTVSGQREYANSIQLDGVESTTNRTQDVTIVPNVDTVQEFKVTTSNFDAEYGDSSGGVVQIQTKAGTNQFHGDAFEFFRPNFSAARPYAFGGKSSASVLKQHDFGGTLGGPILRDRSFFFVAYEGVRMTNAYTYLYSTIPSQLFTIASDGTADFSRLLDPCAGQQCKNSQGQPSGPPAGTVDPIYDPSVSYSCYGYCSQQFAGNIIPGSEISKAGLNTMLNFFPKPNLPGTNNGWFNNYSVDSPVNDNTDKVDGRFDEVLSAKDRLYTLFHWYGDNQLVTDPYHGATVVPGGGDADQANKQDDGAYSVSVTEDHSFSPATLNEFRFGLNRYYQDQYSLLNGTDYSTKYGWGNVAVPGYPATIGYPQIYMADGWLAGGSTYKPYHVLDNNLQFTDSVTWSGIGGHEIKAGGDLRLLNSHPNFSLFPTGFDYFESFGYSNTSDLTFNNFTYYCNVPGGWNCYGGSDITDLLLGLPTDVYIGLQLTKPHTQSWDMDFYAQDTYRLTPKLTLDYGLRYEYYNPWTEANNYMANFDLASGHILVAGRGGNSAALMATRRDDFAPRFGAAYMVNNKTVVRLGLGVFFSPENDAREDVLTMNAPFAQQAAYSDWPYNGPPQYQADTGVARSTAINIPSSGYIDPSTLQNGNLETTYGVDPKLKTGTVESWNLALERQLSRDLSVDVSYVGNTSHDLSYQIGDINANPNDSSNNYNNRVTSSLGQIQYLGDYGMGNFNALEVKVTRRATKNLSFLASYTYGHTLDNGPAPFDVGHENNDSPQNPYNLGAEYGTSDYDVRNNFVFSGFWYLPFGRGQRFGSNWNRATDMILGGWQLNSIYNMQSGTPVNVVRGNNPASILPGLRPNVTGDPNLPRGKRTMMEYFNTSAFCAGSCGLSASSFAPGDASRNLVVGPGYINLDASLFKQFSAGEGRIVQLRLEAFNSLNNPHFANPDGNFSDATFGEITREQNGPDANRVAQIAAKFIF